MEIGQRLAIIEPCAFRHEVFDELKHAVGAISEAAQGLMRVDAALGLSFIEPALGAGSVLGRRQIDEG